MKKKKKKKKTLEYLQQLQNEILEEEAVLLKSTEGSQITGPKYKKVPPGDDVDHQPSKKAKGNNQQGTKETLESSQRMLTLVKDTYVLGRTTQCIIQDE